MTQLRMTLLVLSSCVVGLLTIQYFICPRYKFSDPKPFAGPRINNPYDSMDAANWVKCNFHAHAHSWGGLTNGHGTAQHIHAAYEKLHYGVHCVSNYHHIDTTNSKMINYISAYEHGYNIQKTHQLVLGGKNVTWLDYVFPQTIHNKQHLLENLREHGSVIVLNHPAIRKGYTPLDLTKIAGYDCMEVLNPSVTSSKEWDAALSAGRLTFIVGDDDIHDVISKKRLRTRCTVVNVRINSGKAVLQALRSGKSYGVIIGETQHHDSLPTLRSLTVRHDSIFIKMSAPAQEAIIIGQNGKILLTDQNTTQLVYRIKPLDHYARATFRYSNGTTIFLNPVYYSNEGGYAHPSASEDPYDTLLFRILGVCVVLIWIRICRWWILRRLPKSGGRLKHYKDDHVFQE